MKSFFYHWPNTACRLSWKWLNVSDDYDYILLCNELAWTRKIYKTDVIGDKEEWYRLGNPVIHKHKRVRTHPDPNNAPQLIFVYGRTFFSHSRVCLRIGRSRKRVHLHHLFTENMQIEITCWRWRITNLWHFNMRFSFGETTFQDMVQHTQLIISISSVSVPYVWVCPSIVVRLNTFHAVMIQPFIIWDTVFWEFLCLSSERLALGSNCRARRVCAWGRVSLLFRGFCCCWTELSGVIPGSHFSA